MTFEDIAASGVCVHLDVEDLRLLRSVFFYFDLTELTKDNPVKYAALQAMGAAFHAVVTACEALAETAPQSA